MVLLMQLGRGTMPAALDILFRVAGAVRTAASPWRRPLTVMAALVFLAGVGVAASMLDIDSADLSLLPLAVIVLAIVPASMALGAVSLQLSARALGRRMRFPDAIATTAYAAIAELLPLPGGAVVRGAALTRSGASLGSSSAMVTVMAIMTLCMRILPTGVAMGAWGITVGWALVAACVAGLGGTVGWLFLRTDAGVVAGFLAVRLASVALAAAHFMAGFLALGIALSPLEAVIFTAAGTIGNAATIVPAGLGITEGIASALALLMGVSPAAAFLVVAVNRLIGLCVAGIVVLHLAVARRKRV